MEPFYKINSLPSAYVSDKVNIKEHISILRRRAEELKLSSLDPASDSTTNSVFEINELSSKFDIEGYKCAQDQCDVQLHRGKPLLFAKKKPTFTKEFLSGTDLATVNHLKSCAEENEILNRDRMKKVKHNRPNLRLKGYKWLDNERFEANTDAMHDLDPNINVKIVVRIYHPFKQTAMNSSRPKLCQEIIILGCQTLADLREMILCTADMGVPKDISVDPHEVITERAWDVYKSGFMFINNIFYNDFRHPNNIDYSAVIREWAEARNLGVYDTAVLEETKMEDLTVQFGYPYVYQHQGDCEHLIVISDISLLSNADSLQSDTYPYIRSVPALHTRYCMVCNKFMAKWMTRGSKRVPVDPCFFCDLCFHSYNYKDGNKIGDFKAYPYLSRSTLL